MYVYKSNENMKITIGLNAMVDQIGEDCAKMKAEQNGGHKTKQWKIKRHKPKTNVKT